MSRILRKDQVSQPRMKAVAAAMGFFVENERLSFVDDGKYWWILVGNRSEGLLFRPSAEGIVRCCIDELSSLVVQGLTPAVPVGVGPRLSAGELRRKAFAEIERAVGLRRAVGF